MNWKITMMAALCVVAQPVFSADGAVELKLRDRLTKLIPEHQPSSVRPSVLPGWYEASYGVDIVYVSADGRYIFQGNLYDADKKEDLTESAKSTARKAVLAKQKEEDMIVFSPSNPKHTVTVFTDVDCGYCRKMHSEIAAYNAQGLKIRYLMFPRAGIGSPSYETAVKVWCSDDRKAALTKAKLGQSVSSKACTNPVEKQFNLAIQLGVRGTPALLLEDGELLMGYHSPADLAEITRGGDSSKTAAGN
jgi:thiol:disulfide interchange protein DsbC